MDAIGDLIVYIVGFLIVGLAVLLLLLWQLGKIGEKLDKAHYIVESIERKLEKLERRT